MMLDGGRRLLDQESSKPKNTLVTLGRFWLYFRPYWIMLILTMIFILVSAWTIITVPDLMGQAVDCYLFPQDPAACWYTDVNPNATTSERLSGLGGLVLILAGLFVLNAIMTGLSFYTLRYAGHNVLRNLRGDLFRRIHSLSLGFFAKQDAGDIMSRVTNDMSTLMQMIQFALIQVVRGVVTIVWIIITMLQMNVPYALISLIMVPFMILVTVQFSQQARKAFRRARQEIGNVNADLQENIAGAREVQAFNREDESIAQFQASNDANRRANIRAAMFTSAMQPVLESLSFISLAVVVVVGGLSVLRNEPLMGSSVITLGLVFAFVGYIQQLNQPISMIAVLWTNVQSGIAGAERIFGLLDEQPEITDKPGAIALPPVKGEIVFEAVEAEYVPGEPVLKGVNLHTKPGEIVAIVGPTGAGKTTMINLLPRFYDVTGGAVKIDGHDVRDVKIDSLRSQIGIVLQDTFLFSDTVMNNIRYGRVGASDEEVIEAAKLVAAHEFIERLPDGYQTVLGERGSGLSQGQRQLIAIARVALMNPNVLILDEATSSVDTRTERVIQKAFEKLLEGRTSFVIAHRLSTIRNADQVLLLQDGEIIERGTHDSLIEQRGAYYDLYMSQFRDEETVTSNGRQTSEPVPTGD